MVSVSAKKVKKKFHACVPLKEKYQTSGKHGFSKERADTELHVGKGGIELWSV
jgi:hypothetical protein